MLVLYVYRCPRVDCVAHVRTWQSKTTTNVKCRECNCLGVMTCVARQP